MTTTGSRSSVAWAMPLTALARPGPRVTTAAPGAPVRSAQVAAMIVAAVSPWARTKGIPAAAAAPTTSRFGPPPGTPNISRVPAPASAATIASAPRGGSRRGADAIVAALAGAGTRAGAGGVEPPPQLEPVGVAVGMEVVDRQFERRQLAVPVEPVDAEHRQARRAAQPVGDVGGGRGGGGVLHRAVDPPVADPVDQADHGDAGPAARLGQPGHLRQLTEPAADLQRDVHAGVAERHPVVQPQERRGHDGVLGGLQLARDLDAG